MNASAARPRSRCPRHRAFLVVGDGRHRRFYELDDVGWEHPLMALVSSSCQRRLPGKNPT